MRFTTINFPQGDIILGVLGITKEDRDLFAEGGSAIPLDLRRNFHLGIALPNVIQVVFVDDDEHYETVLRHAGLDPDSIQELPEGDKLV